MKEPVKKPEPAAQASLNTGTKIEAPPAPVVAVSTVIEDFVPETKPEPQAANPIVETKPLVIVKPAPAAPRVPVVSGISARTAAEMAAGRRAIGR